LTEAAAFHYSFGRSITAFEVMVPVSIGRRSFLSTALLAFVMTSQGRAQVGTAEAATGDASATAYMRRVADDLIAASRQGTVMSFHRVITRHANVEAIANYALGPYRAALPRSAFPSYYKGVAMFMARYFADSSREYAVAKAEIGQATRDKDGRVMVNTRVTLLTGSTYNVIFQLSRAGNEYRILDVSVLGFSLSYLQRGIFQRYIAKNGGNVNALVAALNR
jgi:phospholipid transport system substrate-binding protein